MHQYMWPELKALPARGSFVDRVHNTLLIRLEEAFFGRFASGHFALPHLQSHSQ